MHWKAASIAVVISLCLTSPTLAVPEDDPWEGGGGNTDPVSPPPGPINRYAVVCVSNYLDVTVNYEYRWGNDAWRPDTLTPRDRVTYSWPYKREDAVKGKYDSPVLNVHVDTDASDATRWVVIRLEKYPTQTDRDCDAGKRYHLAWTDATERTFDVTPDN